VSFLQKSRTGIAVGTPQRLIDLIENGTYNNTPSRNKSPLFSPVNPFPDALSLANLKRIVVDASHIDQKKRGIVDMRETMMPLAKLLCMQVLKGRYEDETARHIDLIFY
jgi:protein CMS1